MSKVALMVLTLDKLVTPAGGTVLDPFLGSGTTALAAYLEGFACLGIEMDDNTGKVAQARWAARELYKANSA